MWQGGIPDAVPRANRAQPWRIGQQVLVFPDWISAAPSTALSMWEPRLSQPVLLTRRNPAAYHPASILVRAITFYAQDLYGRYRISDAALDRYELYRGVNADVDYSAAWETFTSLPHTTAALVAG